MPEPTTLAEARSRVAAVVVDDVEDLASDEDLRDVGLDSIRLMTLLGDLRSGGTAVELDDVLADPTLRGLAAAMDAVRTTAGGPA